MPLTSVGVATTALVDATVLANAAKQGSQALDDAAAAAAKGGAGSIPKSGGQPVVNAPTDDSPDAISPAGNPAQNPQTPPQVDNPPKVQVTQEPLGSRIGHPTFIGNAAWITPGTLVALGNTVWQKLQPQRYLSPKWNRAILNADNPLAIRSHL